MKLLQERVQLLSCPTRQTRARTTTAQRLALTELDGGLLREEVARSRDDDVTRVRRPAPRHLLAHLAVAPVSTLYTLARGGGWGLTLRVRCWGGPRAAGSARRACRVAPRCRAGSSPL